MTQVVKNLFAMQETWVQFQGQEESLEERNSPLAIFLPTTESHEQKKPGGLESMGLQ